jgi:hypothetical protein
MGSLRGATSGALLVVMVIAMKRMKKNNPTLFPDLSAWLSKE